MFGRTNGFNRRQENIIQYWSPNWNGFVFRFAWTLGYRDEMKALRGDGELDPVIRSSSLAYTNGPFWAAVTWQDHEDWAAASAGEMTSSDAESFRIAGRYIMDMGDGVSVQISAMWEDVEHEFNGVTNFDTAMAAFGYSKSATYGISHDVMYSATGGGENGPTIKGLGDAKGTCTTGEKGLTCTSKQAPGDGYKDVYQKLWAFKQDDGTITNGEAGTTQPFTYSSEKTADEVGAALKTLNDVGDPTPAQSAQIKFVEGLIESHGRNMKTANSRYQNRA